VPGDATTDFGVPGAITPSDHGHVTTAEAERLAALVRAAWTVFDQVAAVSPEELRKGPRGGGRDRTKMMAHVFDAEAGYARYLGRKPKPPGADNPAAVDAGLLAERRLRSWRKLQREMTWIASRTDARLRAEHAARWRRIARESRNRNRP